MRVLTTPRFDLAVKKLHAQDKKALDAAVHAVIANLDLGEFKKGDLAGVRVYKYRYNKEQMLLAYAANKVEQVIILMGFGSHENFYRDLKH
jgi:mRNA-degrading endonuclease RelE of RelBE toxin-antitoxin system